MKEQFCQKMQSASDKILGYKSVKEHSVNETNAALPKDHGLSSIYTNEKVSVITVDVLKALMNLSTDIFTILSPEGAILYESDSNEKILGYKKNELIGLNVFKFIHKDDVIKMRKEISKCLGNPGISMLSVYRFRKADGNYAFLESTGTNYNTQANKNIVITSRDVTARIESEKKINRLTAAVEQSSNTVVITDIEGKIEYVNKKFADLTGYDKNEIIDGKPSLLRSGQTSNETYKNLWSTILTGRVWEGELRNKKKSGDLYWERIKITPVVDENDLVTNFIAIKDDVTSEKKINEMLAQSLFEKEIIMKEIHHRVKNNLQIVISLLNLQSNSVPDIKLKNQLTISQNRVRSMALIHQLLYRSSDLSSINMDEYLLRISSQLLSTYIDQKESIKIKVNAKNIFFSIDTAIPFGLLINELVTNSLKHGFPEERNGNIEITLTQNETDHFELNYYDDGIGIPITLVNGHAVNFGMYLIEILVTQLEGDIKLYPSNGTNYIINFRGSNYQTRFHYS